MIDELVPEDLFDVGLRLSLETADLLPARQLRDSLLALNLSPSFLCRKGMQSGISISPESYDLTMKIQNSRLSPYFCSSACPWFW